MMTAENYSVRPAGSEVAGVGRIRNRPDESTSSRAQRRRRRKRRRQALKDEVDLEEKEADGPDQQGEPAEADADGKTDEPGHSIDVLA